jgi:hypothetical protein
MKNTSETFRTARLVNRLGSHATVLNTGYGGVTQRLLSVLLVLVSFAMLAGSAQAGRLNGGIGIPGPAPLLQPTPVPAQFDLLGFIQDATLAPVGSMCPSVTDPRLMGGTVTLNGQKIIVPCNTILQFPAFAGTWADVFTMAPKDITPAGRTGLSLNDPFVPGTNGLLNSAPTGFNSPLPSHEIQVVGNVINGKYIAGLIFISQQGLNGGQGVISCIDYVTGELQVGGTIQPHGSPCSLPVPAGVARVRMNDPDGRYGIVHGGPGSGADVEEAGYDPRYTADTENPTMHSALGFPICIPAFNPTQTIDARCPIYNRPIVPNCKSFDPATLLPSFGAQAGVGGYCTTWVMDAPGAHTAAKPEATDPTLAAPLVIGDTIGFHGTLKADTNGVYVSAHTIDANLGIYTQPHTKPSYVFMEGVLVGAGGGTGGGIAIETTSKVSWVGFTTDPTELVDFFSLTQDPVTGAVKEFYLQTYNPCCTPLGRFRSPANNIGAFGDPQRNYRAVSRTMCQPDGANGALTPTLQTICHMDPLYAPNATAKQASTTPTPIGLMPGQYTLPVFEFIFAENLNFGTPLVENNFQDLPFLFCGSGPIDGPGSGTTVVGQLDPAPWASPMPDPIFHSTLCPAALAVGASSAAPPPPPGPKPPVINSVTATPASTTVGTLTTVTLAVLATNPNTPATAMSYAWTAPAGVVLSCGVCAPNANNAAVIATFNPTAAGTLAFGVTVLNGVSPNATGSTSVLVAGATAAKPIVRTQGATPAGTVNGGTVVTLSATGNTNPAGGAVTVSFRQTGGAAVTLSPVTMTGTAPSDQIGKATFTVPFGPATQFTFVATMTSTASGLTKDSGTITVKTAATPPDTIAFLGGVVNYLNLGNVGGVVAQRGKLTISVTSTATPAPLGMTMTATFSNNTLPANVPGSSALPISVPLLLTAADPPGTTAGGAVCGPIPCWTKLVSAVISNTTVTPAVLVPPTTVTVRSSLGGTATATGAAIVIR